MADLVSWLEAQIAEDERIALVAAADVRGLTTGPGKEWVADEWGDIPNVTSEGYGGGGLASSEIAQHIATFDPARVLAECEAKRAIIAAAQAAESRCHDDDQMPEGTEWNLGNRQGAWQAACLLAAVYADRPGYDETWRP